MTIKETIYASRQREAQIAVRIFTYRQLCKILGNELYSEYKDCEIRQTNNSLLPSVQDGPGRAIILPEHNGCRVGSSSWLLT